MTRKLGTVVLVGAGPGDPGLITRRGLDWLRQADVVVHDRLVGAELIVETAEHAEVIDAGKSPGQHKLSQEDINNILIDRARRGLDVVRLKGGDPFVFGRGWEELSACRRAGVPCLMIPGVSSALAVPALADIPVTLRATGRNFAVMTAHTAEDEGPGAAPFEALARLDTVVILMGRANLGTVVERLQHAGRTGDTPVACIERGATPHQRVLTGTLATIAEQAQQAHLQAPMVAVVGEVVRCADATDTTRLPLRGRRVLVTRPRSSSQPLIRRLQAAGATVIGCPLIDIVYPERCPELDREIADLARFEWITFTSVHSVRSFWRRLVALDGDGRSLAGCSIAAIGAGTAAALATCGIRADLVPETPTSEDLARALGARRQGGSARVLLPRSSIGRRELPDGLRALGFEVSEVTSYHTVAVPPGEEARQQIEQGVDAALFYSPSAVGSFVTHGLQRTAAVIACIGRTTADAACNAGLDVAIVAVTHDDKGMLRSLEEHFAAAMVERSP